MDKTNEERNEDFIEWTTFTEDRFNDWVKPNPKLAKLLDWSPNSLIIVENYLLENFTIEDLENQENKTPIDAIVSYVAETIRKNIPETIWKIDLEDKTNIYYRLPYLVFKLGAPTCPHDLIKDCVGKREHGMIKSRFDYHNKKWIQYQDYLKTNE
ncbi:hypothetical protein ACOKFD_00670 [Flagellimonas sp. S174]|uniref:hypothetical protein n=1 Tax=Flagellimonas sp. S174 TaxID=3410790 RepID=UPI003BF54EE5